jgi:lipid II:glycine glycyltransferase (peptidoglycan interpeptide bridge formation enzyme)
MDNQEKFIQENSPDGGFLQSEYWRKFQEAAGRRTFCISDDTFYASIIEHELPVIGNYFYIPRGPICLVNSRQSTVHGLADSINLAKKEKAGWIRIDLANNEILEHIKNSINYKIKKVPHDMQPKEVFVVDITKSEEDLLSEMKSKTRYNIKVAQKHNVKIIVTYNSQPESVKYLEKFLELVKITAKRDGITPHPENYYRQMFEIIPGDIIKLYVAEYNGKVIAANIIIFYGNTATYLHGASDNESRNVMAPYLLQWQAIMDAKKFGCKKYDFGGVKTGDNNSWSGITKFKTGFSLETKSIKFPGSYDIILDNLRYSSYRFIQALKSLI